MTWMETPRLNARKVIMRKGYRELQGLEIRTIEKCLTPKQNIKKDAEEVLQIEQSGMQDNKIGFSETNIG